MKPKILYIHEKLGFSGGAEKYIFLTSSYLKSHFDCELLFSSRTGNQEQQFQENFKSVCQTDFEIEATQNLFDKTQPQLIFLQKCSNPSIIKQCIDSGIPTVRMMHDHELYCLRKSKYFPISREICPYKAGLCCLVPGLAFLGKDEQGAWCLRNPHYFDHKKLVKLDQQCSAFFVASRYMKKELITQGYPENKIHIFPPVEPFSIDVAADFSKNQLLYVGQLLRGKGLDCLLNALQKVKTDFKLKVLGDGPFLQECQKLTNDLGLDKKVEFHGFVPHDQMTQFYAKASCGVVPSVWPEPFGMVGLEFMKHSLPVVAFDSGGISDWLHDGENGYLVPHMDIAKMAERIDQLLSNKPFAKQMGKKGREIITKDFNFESHMNKMVSAFNEMTNNSL